MHTRMARRCTALQGLSDSCVELNQCSGCHDGQVMLLLLLLLLLLLPPQRLFDTCRDVFADAMHTMTGTVPRQCQRAAWKHAGHREACRDLDEGSRPGACIMYAGGWLLPVCPRAASVLYQRWQPRVKSLWRECDLFAP